MLAACDGAQEAELLSEGMEPDAVTYGTGNRGRHFSRFELSRVVCYHPAMGQAQRHGSHSGFEGPERPSGS